MPKLLRWLDIVLLITALALLVIDLQIKADIVERAKKLEATLNGQEGTPERDRIHSPLPSDILLCDGDDKPAVADEAPIEASVKRTRPRTRRAAAANRSAGNDGEGIQPDGEPVGP